jgi:hypothetical protein
MHRYLGQAECVRNRHSLASESSLLYETRFRGYASQLVELLAFPETALPPRTENSPPPGFAASWLRLEAGLSGLITLFYVVLPKLMSSSARNSRSKSCTLFITVYL